MLSRNAKNANNLHRKEVVVVMKVEVEEVKEEAVDLEEVNLIYKLKAGF